VRQLFLRKLPPDGCWCVWTDVSLWPTNANSGGPQGPTSAFLRLLKRFSQEETRKDLEEVLRLLNLFPPE
jgi:hypothetical protein